MHTWNAPKMILRCKPSLKKGADLSQIPLDRLGGKAVILNLVNAKAEGGVTLQQVQDAAKIAGGARNGDIVFCRMGPTPCFSTAPLKWLVGQGMKMMGVDSGGVELADDKTHSNVNHLVLFRAGIPVIENLANLSRISRPHHFRREQRDLSVAIQLPERLETLQGRIAVVEDDYDQAFHVVVRSLFFMIPTDLADSSLQTTADLSLFTIGLGFEGLNPGVPLTLAEQHLAPVALQGAFQLSTQGFDPGVDLSQAIRPRLRPFNLELLHLSPMRCRVEAEMHVHNRTARLTKLGVSAQRLRTGAKLR